MDSVDNPKNDRTAGTRIIEANASPPAAPHWIYLALKVFGPYTDSALDKNKSGVGAVSKSWRRTKKTSESMSDSNSNDYLTRIVEYSSNA